MLTFFLVLHGKFGEEEMNIEKRFFSEKCGDNR